MMTNYAARAAPPGSSPTNLRQLAASSFRNWLMRPVLTRNLRAASAVRFAQGKKLGELAMATRKRFEPRIDVEHCTCGCRCASVAIFDQHLFPCVFGVINIIEPLDDDVFPRLAVTTEHVADVQMPADFSVIAGLF